jgi:hypothetical protein
MSSFGDTFTESTVNMLDDITSREEFQNDTAIFSDSLLFDVSNLKSNLTFAANNLNVLLFTYDPVSPNITRQNSSLNQYRNMILNCVERIDLIFSNATDSIASVLNSQREVLRISTLALANSTLTALVSSYVFTIKN